MTTLFRTFSICIAAAFTLAAAGLAQAQGVGNTSADARAGIAKLVRGPVTVAGTAGPRQLQPGDALAADDRITTGDDGSASVVLRDGTVLVVGPKSTMEMRGFAFDSTTNEGNVAINLLRGSMRMVTGLIGKHRHDAVKLTTPTSTIGILGTDIIVAVEEPTAAAR